MKQNETEGCERKKGTAHSKTPNSQCVVANIILLLNKTLNSRSFHDSCYLVCIVFALLLDTLRDVVIARITYIQIETQHTR